RACRWPKLDHREVSVRRRRLALRLQPGGRRPRRRSDCADRADRHGRDVERAGRETVRPRGTAGNGGLAPRGARGIPHRHRAPNVGGTRGRIRLFVAEETTRPEAVTRASVLWIRRGDLGYWVGMSYAHISLNTMYGI